MFPTVIHMDVILALAGSHLDHPLQAHTEVLLLVELEFLQRHTSLSDELIMAKLILIAHCEPAEREHFN